jgi:peptidoglycan hydrolase CwlO-like protein
MTGEEMAVKVAEVDHRSRSNTRRIEKLETTTDAIHSLAESIAVLVNEQQNQTASINRIEKNVATLDGKVEALENKPGKRWDAMADKVLWALIAAVIAYVLGAIGL